MNIRPSSFAAPLFSSLALGLLSTFGDWLWTHYIPDGAVVPGVAHGAVIFLALAVLLAHDAGTSRAWKFLLPTLPVAGLGIAAGFYPVAMATNYLIGLLVSWVAMWMVLAVLQRIARGKKESLGRAITRGVLAAVGSGLAFWAISGIWTQPSPDGPNYLWHFFCWTVAFLPGFIALQLEQPAAEP